MAARLNLPYLVELAYIARAQGSTEELRDTAEAKGIAPDAFDRVVAVLETLPAMPANEAELSHALYLLDGAARGYIEPGKIPSPWVCGQLADAHYRP